MTWRMEEALDRLKSMGVRMTPQRSAILIHLLESTTHPTADEIYKALEKRFPSMSVATVYNNLKKFVDAGMLRELTYGDSSSRFDADLSNHYHAICNHCGTIVDFKYQPLMEVEYAAAAETGFVVQGHRMEIYGTCTSCNR